MMRVLMDFEGGQTLLKTLSTTSCGCIDEGTDGGKKERRVR